MCVRWGYGWNCDASFGARVVMIVDENEMCDGREWLVLIVKLVTVPESFGVLVLQKVERAGMFDKREMGS